MSKESQLSSKETGAEKIVKAISVGLTLVGLYGVVEGIRYQQTPDFQDYKAQKTSLSEFERTLVSEGVLVDNGRFLSPWPYDVGISDDPRASEWGKERRRMNLLDVEKSNENAPLGDQLKQAAVVGFVFGPLLFFIRKSFKPNYSSIDEL